MVSKRSKSLILGGIAVACALLVSCSPSGSGGSGTEGETEIADNGAAQSSTNGELSQSAGVFISHEEYSADPAAYVDTDVVLFFNATWCPPCKAAINNLQSDPGSIPAGLTIVAVDYDDSMSLRQLYGVTIQHTFVHIDGKGNELKKWAGSMTAAEIFSEMT